MSGKMKDSSLKKFRVSYRGYDISGIYVAIVSAKSAPEAASLVREGADNCDEIIQIMRLQDETD